MGDWPAMVQGCPRSPRTRTRPTWAGKVQMETRDGAKVIRRVHVSDAAYSNGMRCGGGSCPAVFETDKGTFFVVGRRLSADERAQLPIDPIEDALEVPAELLEGCLRKLEAR